MCEVIISLQAFGKNPFMCSGWHDVSNAGQGILLCHSYVPMHLYQTGNTMTLPNIIQHSKIQ
jgi:hypothetical protein